MNKPQNTITTVPVSSNKDQTDSFMRLDYIFLSKSVTPHLTDYSVIENDITNSSSDHYPVAFVYLSFNF